MNAVETSLKFVGKLGARVYMYLNGVHCSRSYFKPVQPGTPAQLARWEKFRAGVLAWRGMTEAEKNIWRDKARNFSFEGFNHFMSKFLRS